LCSNVTTIASDISSFSKVNQQKKFFLTKERKKERKKEREKERKRERKKERKKEIFE